MRPISAFFGIACELQRPQTVTCKPGLEVFPDLEEHVIELGGPAIDAATEGFVAVECQCIKLHRGMSHIGVDESPFIVHDKIHRLTVLEGQSVLLHRHDRNTCRTGGIRRFL